MIYSKPTRELRELLDAQSTWFYCDESDEWDGYHMERTVIPLENDLVLSVIWGETTHHDITMGVNYGYPEKLEAYIRPLNLEPFEVSPEQVMAMLRDYPNWKGVPPYEL